MPQVYHALLALPPIRARVLAKILHPASNVSLSHPAADTACRRREKRGKLFSLTHLTLALVVMVFSRIRRADGRTVGPGVAKSFRRKSAPRLGKLLQFRALRGSSRTMSLLLAFASSLRQAGISSLCFGESFSCDPECTGMGLGVAFGILMYEDN